MAWKYRADEIDSINLTNGIDLSTAAGGVRPATGLWHTGGHGAQISSDGVDSTPVITEIYVATLVIPLTILATGIAIFNGSAVSGNFKVGLFNQAGTLLRASASTAQSGTDAYQSAPFATNGSGAAATTVVLPTGTYHIGLIFDNTTSRFNAHGVGVFPDSKVTGATFATAMTSANLTITPPTSFTAASLPPIATVY